MVTRPNSPLLWLVAVFDAVRRHGGLQHAAKELGVSQTAVKQAIEQLEDLVGTSLLYQDARLASLTEAGLRLHLGVSKGLGEIDNAVAEVRAMQEAADADITVACTVEIATYWLMPCLTGFYAQNSDAAVSVRTVAAGAPSIVPGIDLAIRYGLGDWNVGPTKLLFRERVVPVCSPALADKLKSQEIQFDDIPLLHVDAGGSHWLGWDEYFERSAVEKLQRAGPKFTNYVQATHAALAGEGVMLGWRSMVEERLQAGKLVELPMPSVVPKEAFYLVLPEQPRQSRLLNAFVGWLMKTGFEVDRQVWPVERRVNPRNI